ncbi:TrbC/VirB2 family protein [Patescibacteria group bacterium]|nr:TrbC/VirB2 family protein [Patescibacteria group bacterium]
MKKTLITLIFLGFVILPLSVYAATTPPATGVAGVIGRAVTELTTIGTALIILMIVYAGILYLIASGEPDKITKAKQALLWAVIGGVVIISANAIKTVIVTIGG